MIKQGTYLAKVISHAISETKGGNPQAVVKFSLDADGPKTLTWYGSFSEKAIEITVKALLACGLQGNNPAGALEIGKEVSIVVEIEKDENGKERNKVRWVNSVHEIKNVIPQDAAKAKLSALEGAVMMARQKLGVSDSDEIPF
jgi:hypothetical protein